MIMNKKCVMSTDFFFFASVRDHIAPLSCMHIIHVVGSMSFLAWPVCMTVISCYIVESTILTCPPECPVFTLAELHYCYHKSTSVCAGFVCG